MASQLVSKSFVLKAQTELPYIRIELTKIIIYINCNTRLSRGQIRKDRMRERKVKDSHKDHDYTRQFTYVLDVKKHCSCGIIGHHIG